MTRLSARVLRYYNSEIVKSEIFIKSLNLMIAQKEEKEAREFYAVKNFAATHKDANFFPRHPKPSVPTVGQSAFV